MLSAFLCVLSGYPLRRFAWKTVLRNRKSFSFAVTGRSKRSPVRVLYCCDRLAEADDRSAPRAYSCLRLPLPLPLSILAPTRAV